MSAKEITATELRGLVAEALKHNTGMGPEEFAAMQAELKAFREQKEAVHRQHTADLAQKNAPRSYKAIAETAMKNDKLGGVGFRLARYVRALAASKQLDMAPEAVAKSWGDDDLADAIVAAREAQTKALSANVPGSGGIMVIPEYAAEMIELLRAGSVVRAAGARTMPIPTGVFNLGRQASSASASYGDEGTNIASSQPTLDQVKLLAKKLRAIVPITNDLVRAASVDADQFVRNDLINVCSEAEDLVFLRADGTQDKPRGIRYNASSTNVFARTQAGGSSTAAEISADIYKMIRFVDQANVKLVSPAWFMSPRTKWHIASLRDGNNNLMFPEVSGGKLLGMPLYTTTQIPNTLGGGTDESEVYLVEMSQVVIGDKTSLLIETFPNGTYFDTATGALRSGISRDESVIRAISEHDIVMRHPEAACVLTGVRWGA